MLCKPKESKEKRPEAVKPVRYKPIPITRMAEETRYSVAEVKFLYRAFKQECPTGISSEEKFKDIYQKLFPLSDSSKYARLVFRSIDRDRTGGITFGDFINIELVFLNSLFAKVRQSWTLLISRGSIDSNVQATS